MKNGIKNAKISDYCSGFIDAGNETELNLFDISVNDKLIGDYQSAISLIRYDKPKKEMQRAYEFLSAAAENGAYDALSVTASMLYYGIGVMRNFYAAFKNAYTSVTSGCNYANAVLGMCYYYGRGVELNYKKAFKCFKSLPGYAPCVNNSAVCYILGNGVAADVKKGFKLLTTHMQSPICAYTLAQCYCEGVGVEVSVKYAEELLRFAYAKGFRPAAFKLFEILSGKGANAKSLSFFTSDKKSYEYKDYVLAEDIELKKIAAKYFR